MLAKIEVVTLVSLKNLLKIEITHTRINTRTDTHTHAHAHATLNHTLDTHIFSQLNVQSQNT